MIVKKISTPLVGTAIIPTNLHFLIHAFKCRIQAIGGRAVIEKLIIVDPLPAIKETIKNTFSEINSSFNINLKLLIAKGDKGYEPFKEKLLASINGDNIGLLFPYNKTGEHLILDSFKKLPGKENADSLDMLQDLHHAVTDKDTNITMPIVIPFLGNPDFVFDKLNAMKITGSLACLVPHISGRDDTFTRDEIFLAFSRHLTQPENENYLIRDYIPKFVRK